MVTRKWKGTWQSVERNKRIATTQTEAKVARSALHHYIPHLKHPMPVWLQQFELTICPLLAHWYCIECDCFRKITSLPLLSKSQYLVEFSSSF